MSTAADGAAYWLRWQVFVCGALIVLPAAAAAALLPRLRRVPAPLRATDLWVPCWARLHPGWLLGYRAFALAAAVALLARLLVAHGLTVFYFYTQWTFLLVTIYFAFATAISAHGCWVYSKKSLRKADESHGFLNSDVENRDICTSISGERKKDETNKMVSYYEQIVNEKRAGFWGHCMQIIYQTSAGATMLTDVTFWGLLVPFFYRGKFGLALVTDGMHSLNAVFLIIDTVLNNMVALPISGPFIIWSSSMVPRHGHCSHPLLLSVLVDRKGEAQLLPKAVPTCLCEDELDPSSNYGLGYICIDIDKKIFPHLPGPNIFVWSRTS
ncbi:uncharacterized protein LOC133892919 isoform X1 [Phragmites australis]|uniref:uncharacterized protein LOC133892919 isoform X1 n=1 Tax=Phragmites australis TaxID=29695 RepID=UPI002D79161F|nr:uncharacterized protein LOC133892919 isoform X1 [Phragmites australis]